MDSSAWRELGETRASCSKSRNRHQPAACRTKKKTPMKCPQCCPRMSFGPLMLPVQFSYLTATRGGRKGGEGAGGWASLTLPTTPNLQVLASIRKTFCQSCTATANKVFVFFFVERISTNETRALHNMLFIFFIFCYGDHKPSPSPPLSHSTHHLYIHQSSHS